MFEYSSLFHFQQQNFDRLLAENKSLARTTRVHNGIIWKSGVNLVKISQPGEYSGTSYIKKHLTLVLQHQPGCQCSGCQNTRMNSNVQVRGTDGWDPSHSLHLPDARDQRDTRSSSPGCQPGWRLLVPGGNIRVGSIARFITRWNQGGRCSIARLSVTRVSGGDLTVDKPGRGSEVIIIIITITSQGLQ